MIESITVCIILPGTDTNLTGVIREFHYNNVNIRRSSLGGSLVVSSNSIEIRALSLIKIRTGLFRFRYDF